MDGETGRLREDAAKGAIAPDFVIDITTGQIGGQRRTPPAEVGYVKSFAAKCAHAGLPACYAARAAQLQASERPFISRPGV